MFKTLLAVVSFSLLSASVSTFAQEKHGDKERKVDIERHRAMAKAHTDMAICLESGKKEDVCEKTLQAACKGLAIGKDCGMKHVH